MRIDGWWREQQQQQSNRVECDWSDRVYLYLYFFFRFVSALSKWCSIIQTHHTVVVIYRIKATRFHCLRYITFSPYISSSGFGFTAHTILMSPISFEYIDEFQRTNTHTQYKLAGYLPFGRRIQFIISFYRLNALIYTLYFDPECNYPTHISIFGDINFTLGIIKKSLCRSLTVEHIIFTNNTELYQRNDVFPWKTINLKLHVYKKSGHWKSPHMPRGRVCIKSITLRLSSLHWTVLKKIRCYYYQRFLMWTEYLEFLSNIEGYGRRSVVGTKWMETFPLF